MGHHRFKGEHLETGEGGGGGQRVRMALLLDMQLCTGDGKTNKNENKKRYGIEWPINTHKPSQSLQGTFYKTNPMD